MHSPIDLTAQESVVYAADMQLLTTGHKGRVLLTDKRFLFVAKQTNKIVIEVRTQGTHTHTHIPANRYQDNKHTYTHAHATCDLSYRRRTST